jgi:hypothetical protein
VLVKELSCHLLVGVTPKTRGDVHNLTQEMKRESNFIEHMYANNWCIVNIHETRGVGVSGRLPWQ